MDRFAVINSPTSSEPSKKGSAASSNQFMYTDEIEDNVGMQSSVSECEESNTEDIVIDVEEDDVVDVAEDIINHAANVNVNCKCEGNALSATSNCAEVSDTTSPVALQLRAPPKVSARAPAHRSYHFRGVKLKSCIKKIHHNLYISKQANVRIKHADTEGASHKKFGTDARVQ